MKLLTFSAPTGAAAPITQAAYFPTVGQYLDIEALKLSLSGGNYNQMLLAESAASVMALDLIDAVAHLQVLCPTLGKELSFGSYLDVPMQKAVQLTRVYKEQFLPWYWPQLRELLADAKLLPPAPVATPAPAASAEPDPTNLDDFNDEGAAMPGSVDALRAAQGLAPVDAIGPQRDAAGTVRL